MKELVRLLEEAKRTGDCSPFTDAIPYAKWLGISAEITGGELVGKLTFSDKLVGNPSIPALHGGTLGALLESTAIFELLWAAETIAVPKTINLTIDFLRSGRPVDTWARGVITKHGRRVVNVSVVAWQEDRARPIASANAHFLIVPVEDDDA